MKLISLKSHQLAVNGFDETYPLVTELPMLDKTIIFLLLSMSNRDVDRDSHSDERVRKGFPT